MPEDYLARSNSDPIRANLMVSSLCFTQHAFLFKELSVTGSYFWELTHGSHPKPTTIIASNNSYLISMYFVGFFTRVHSRNVFCFIPTIGTGIYNSSTAFVKASVLLQSFFLPELMHQTKKLRIFLKHAGLYLCPLWS